MNNAMWITFFGVLITFQRSNPLITSELRGGKMWDIAPQIAPKKVMNKGLLKTFLRKILLSARKSL